ncbi:NucA/NucB deoxyribonuclease domain-containing protein [Kitasatospora purpeofusca]|uniref:NucA/NucB deoxyribonuclease domain-containing protein n=1 Tax=Kitasatospora purpeofusca TaxID=67352 RepID=UPI00369400FD
MRSRGIFIFALVAAAAISGIGTVASAAEPELTFATFLSATKLPDLPSGTTKSDAIRILTSQGAREASGSDSKSKHPEKSELPFTKGSADLAGDSTPNTFQTCQARPEGNADMYGQVINRQTFCRHGYAEVMAWRGDIPLGTLSYRETHIATAVNGNRESLIGVKLDDFKPGGIWSNNSMVEITLATKSEQDASPGTPTACKAIGATNPFGGTLSQWKAKSEIGWSIVSDSAFGVGDEKLVDCHWQVEHRALVASPFFHGGWTGKMARPAQDIRFDSTNYLPQREGAVFSRAIPYLEYSRTDPRVKGVAEHIYTAFTNPAATLPAKTDGTPKVIPGNISGNPPSLITRLYPGANPIAQQAYNDNRAVVASACATIPHNPGEECDEFPFASTWEGAAMNDQKNFSVRYVHGVENGNAGGDLSAWYGSSRVIHNEKFGVDIIP